MTEKITKKNSLFFNQCWINKAIEEGNMKFLPCKKQNNMSIGEIIEYNYNLTVEQEQIKITKSNSILFTKEWIKKYKEEGLEIPNRILGINHSLGEQLELLYFEREKLKEYREKEKSKALELHRKWWCE